MLFINIRIVSALVILLSLAVNPVFAAQTPVAETATVESSLVDLASMTNVGDMSALGVQARAYVTAVHQNTNIGATHQVVVTFVNEKTGVSVEKALVGIKLRRLFGEASEPTWMRASTDQPNLFVADVTLKSRGTYLFIVGSKLDDNKKRQFTFEYSY